MWNLLSFVFIASLSACCLREVSIGRACHRCYPGYLEYARRTSYGFGTPGGLTGRKRLQRISEEPRTGAAGCGPRARATALVAAGRGELLCGPRELLSG